MTLSNNPPDACFFAGEVSKDLSDWMAEHPVIQTEEDARAAKLLVDRAKNTFKDMEAERTAKVAPLNAQVTVINDAYRGPRTTLENVLQHCLNRIEAYRKDEEAKRLAAAQAAREAAEEAERLARAAEEAERNAKSEASSGVIGVDMRRHTEAADKAFSRFEKASRTASRLEKDVKVRIGGGFGRALTARTKETLHVGDWQAAIGEMGLTDGIRDAILTAARAWRKEFGELPDGINAEEERSI